MRAPNAGSPGLFERAMNEAAKHLWLSVVWFRPDVELGPGATFHRDNDMVRFADVVLAYFKGVEMTGGTGHVVQAAIEFGTPVYAWGWKRKGFVRIGEHDPDEAWAEALEPSEQLVDR